VVYRPPRRNADSLLFFYTPPEHHFLETSPIEARELALDIADFLHQNQAESIAILDVSVPLAITDYFVIASARNARHALAMSSELDFTMKQAGRLRRNLAGNQVESTWVLLDFDEVIVHIFVDTARKFYDLEMLWADAPRLEFSPREPEEQPDSGGEGTPPLPETHPGSTDPH